MAGNVYKSVDNVTVYGVYHSSSFSIFALALARALHIQVLSTYLSSS
jgi:hypothetical protein